MVSVNIILDRLIRDGFEICNNMIFIYDYAQNYYLYLGHYPLQETNFLPIDFFQNPYSILFKIKPLASQQNTKNEIDGMNLA